jgi:hypothetical protein
MNRILVLACVLVAQTSTDMPALASVQAVAVANSTAPVALRHCASNGSRRLVIAFNRSSVPVSTFVVRLSGIDRSGKSLGSADVEYDATPSLASGTAGNYTQEIPDDALSGAHDAKSIASVTCRIVQVSFVNGGTWSPGKSWPSATQEHNGRLWFSVENAWNDVANGQTFVHDTIVLHGGSNEATVSPDNFVLTITLANGGIERYTGLKQPAPTYSRYNVLLKTSAPVNEVDQASDLGALGSITIPADGTVHITVTFVVPVPLADPNANRNVSMNQ